MKGSDRSQGRRRSRSGPRPALPTGRRLWLLRFLLVLFAFSLLALLEVGLRLAGVAAPEPLLLRIRQDPLDVYMINPKVGLRFFPPEMEKIMPKPGFQIFPVKKDPRSLRIFVLGGSTTAGFPYHLHGSISEFLQDRLSVLLPDRRVEVVNFAMTALNSYAVLDYVRELRRYQPDLFVLYTGHNEYYGAFGPGSAIAFGKSRATIQTLRWILGLRISRLLQSGLRALRGPPKPVQGETLMGAMVGRTNIRKDDPVFRAGLEGFETNVKAAVAAAGDVPVVLCEVVSNLRDQPPFGSSHPPGLDPADAKRFESLIEGARGSMNRGDDEAARSALRTAIGIDSTYAETRYLYGRVLERAGRLERAAAEYRAARDLDVIRFRASSEINQALRRIAEGTPAYLARTERAFDERSAPFAPGANLFFEHLHPRLEGTQILSSVVIHLLCDQRLLVPPGSWRWNADASPEEYRIRTGITPLDQEIADRRVFHLTHKWPYPEEPGARYVSSREPQVQELAEEVLSERIDLAEAHWKLGGRYRDEDRLADAERELSTACKIFPVVPQRMAVAGQVAWAAGDSLEALGWLRRAVALDPSSAAYARLLAETQRRFGSPSASGERGR